ncbi:NDP-hexose 2,3-dehydratase family protein [Georgenia sunbinii]|uniref:NDP-hexose 2,3-dehydratase family protein n=1 Tax=Georgenia sunbinii TaxID=3117728 RepID=UPI002F269101
MSTFAAVPTDVAGVLRVLEEERTRQRTDAAQVPLREVSRWDCRPDAAEFSHDSGRFFSVIGLEVDDGRGRSWHQPIIRQPEVGVLGLLVRRAGGTVSALVQLKAEPGNPSGLQLSPTVQATHSNYSGVHGGAAVPYLEHFLELHDPARPAPPRQVHLDVLQSEIGGRFLAKQNRNMVVETSADVAAQDGFHWLPLETLWGMHDQADLVNMDLRSILGGLPAGLTADATAAIHAVATTIDPDVSRWLDEGRRAAVLTARPVPLGAMAGWVVGEDAISHEAGRYFDVIGVRVEASGREVSSWCQPMVAPRFTGLLALTLARGPGGLHALVRLHVETGSWGRAEVGPTVQCAPENHGHLPPDAWPPLLREVRDGELGRIVFDGTLADEGGRFYHARNRHLVTVTELGPPPPGFRWVPLPQLRALARQGRTVTMELRSLLSCVSSLHRTGRGDLP